MKNKSLGKRLLIIGLSMLGLLIIALGLVFIIDVNNYYHAVDVDDYLVSGEKVTVVENSDYIAFEPKDNTEYGYIFYPGAKVEETAYSQLMYELAEDGILTVIVRMPFRYAFFNMNGADKVLEKYSGIDNFYIGGHSLGGAMSMSYLSSHKSEYKGGIMLAAYSTESYKNTSLRFLSIYGSNDKVLNISKTEKRNEENFDTNLEVFEITGGNHAGFASYGKQAKDGDLEITNQIELTRNKMASFIKGK